jgi:hypothetical protein
MGLEHDPRMGDLLSDRFYEAPDRTVRKLQQYEHRCGVIVLAGLLGGVGDGKGARSTASIREIARPRQEPRRNS